MKYMDYICDCCELISVELLDRIEEAKKGCESLGIGVFSDEYAEKILKRKPIRPYIERSRIIYSIKNVDFVFKVTDENNIIINKEEFFYNNSKEKNIILDMLLEHMIYSIRVTLNTFQKLQVSAISLLSASMTMIWFFPIKEESRQCLQSIVQI